MASKYLIYPNLETGSICWVTMAEDSEMTLEEIAKKDVPTGLPYKFVYDQDVPPEEDWEFFNAFEADFTENDGLGADYGVGSNFAVIEIAEGAPSKLKDETSGEIIELQSKES